MKFHVLVHLKSDVLDVQGQAIHQAIAAAGHMGVRTVRQGKSFYVELDGADSAKARAEVERLCRETLANPTMETFTVEAMS